MIIITEDQLRELIEAHMPRWGECNKPRLFAALVELRARRAAELSAVSPPHPDTARLDKLQEENTGLRLIVAALKRTKMHGPKCICTNCETLNAHQEPKP